MFAPQAADLRSCGRSKQHVGSEFMPSVGSSAIFSRSARVQLRLFVPEGPSNGAAEERAKKSVAGVESTGSTQVLKTGFCIQFRVGARTVLRTGRIVTLHP
jgi:hypothetical protein